MADIGAHSTSGGVTGTSPFTWSHTVTVDDTYLVVCVRTRDSVAADSQATAVTFNGDALSLLHRSSAIPSGGSDTHTVEWWSLRNPDIGTFTVSVTTGGDVFRGGLSATNLRGIATTGELLATATNSGANTATEATVSVSSTEAGAVVLLAMYSGASGATLSGATQRDLTSFETDISGLASSIPSSVQTVTATWTHDAAEAIGSMASAIVLRAADTTGTTLGLVIGSATAFVGEGFIGSIEAVSGPTYTQSLSASLTPAAAIVRDPRKPLAASLTSTAALVKQTAKRVSGSLTAAAATIKRTDKPLGGSITGTTTVSGARAILRALSASLTPAATVTRLTSKSLGASLTAAATVRKDTRKTLAAALTATATVTKRTARALTATLTAAATVTKRTARNLGASLTPAAALAKQTAKTLAAVLTPATSLLTTLLGNAARGLVTAILTLRNVASALTARPVDAALTARAPRADLTQRAEAVTTLTAQTGVDTALTTRAPDADLTARPSTDGVLRLETDDPVP